MDYLSRFVSPEEAMSERGGFSETLIRALDRAARSKRPRAIRLSVADHTTLCAHLALEDNSGWFLWRGAQIVLQNSRQSSSYRSIYRLC
jgi:hypothetical protein